MSKEIKYLGEEALKSLVNQTVKSLNEKQDKFTGVKGQIIGFDDNGNAVTQNLEFKESEYNVQFIAKNSKLPTSIGTNIIYTGDNYISISDDFKVLYSKDGINWKIGEQLQYHTNDFNARNQISNIVYNNNVYVFLTQNVYDYYINIYYSYNGLNWQIVNLDSTNIRETLYGVAMQLKILAKDNQIIAIGFDPEDSEYINYSLSSDDGLVWKANKLTSIPSTNGIRYIQYCGDKFIAVTETEENIFNSFNSNDGLTWTEGASIYTATDYKNQPNDFIYADNKAVLLVASGEVYYKSDDDLVWKLSQKLQSVGGPDYDSWVKIVYYNNKFITLSMYNSLAYTEDIAAGNWTLKELTSLEPIEYRKILYADNLLIGTGAINIDDNYENYTFISEDGINWYYYNQESRLIYPDGTDITYDILKCLTDTEISENNGKAITSGAVATALSNKQDKLIGEEGQLLSFDDEGNAIAIDSSEYVQCNTTEILLPTGTGGWNQIVYGDGKYVAISPANYIAYSEDAINWNSVILPIPGNYLSIAYGNNTFVAVGASGKIIYSNDGINWNQSNILGNNPWQKVTYGNGKFVAIAPSRYIGYSEDGIEWSTIELGNLFNDSYYNITFINEQFIGIGINYIVRSKDAINWEYSSMISLKSEIASYYYNCNIIYGNNMFFTIPYDSNSNTKGSNIVLYSKDSFTWEKAYLPVYGHWKNICYGNGKIVAISYEGKTVYSYDGINWYQGIIISQSNGQWTDVIYKDNKFIAIGQMYTLIAYSYDGIKWFNKISSFKTQNEDITELITSVNETYSNNNEYLQIDTIKNNFPLSNSNYSSMAYGNNTFIAVAQGNLFLSSKDGFAWKTCPISWGNGWSYICYGNGMFLVIPASGSQALYSIDGISWESTNLSINTGWNASIYANNKFIIVPANDSVFYYSENGIDWNFTSIITPPPKRWLGITYGNNKFVAITDDYYIASSSDGINWTIEQLPFTPSSGLSSIIYGDNKFIIYSASQIFYSTDTINWKTIELNNPNNYELSIFYDNNKFIGVYKNSNIAIYSKDGINWTQTTLPKLGDWRHVVYGDGKFIMSSQNNGILYSLDGIKWTEELPQIYSLNNNITKDFAQMIGDISGFITYEQLQQVIGNAINASY